MPSQTLNIQRTFRETAKGGREVADQMWIVGQSAAYSSLNWGALLCSRRVLLISEAGTGKTYECRRQAESLFAAGHPAFFLRLETIAADGLANTLYGTKRKRFDEWKAAGSGMGYFFLDSIDELELVHGDFSEALRRLADELEDELYRSTIVITSRPVAIDRAAFRELLPVNDPVTRVIDGDAFVQLALQGPKKDAGPPDFREVELLPFTDADIIDFAGARRITSPDELLAAIHARHAHDFARRPQDLIELCDDWRDHGRIRTHLDQVVTHVATQLAARPNRKEKAELSVESARNGAQRLALASILMRRLTIRHSTGADMEGSGEAPLDPRHLLAQWNVKEIATLLERPLFGPAGYGRVRFQHRSVLEYLAACQIDHLLETSKLSLTACLRLLFGLTGDNKRVLKPSMRPVAGWLSLLRTDVFEYVVADEPSALLIQGDPESMNDCQRDRAFAAFVAQYGKGQWRGLEVPALQIERLAQPSLANAVLKAWGAGIENPEVRQLLIKLVSAGKFRSAADLMASIVSNPHNDWERFLALVALADLDDPRTAGLVDAAIAGAAEWSVESISRIATWLYPNHLSDRQLVRIIDRLPPKSRRSNDYASRIASHLEHVDVCTLRLSALLQPVVERVEGLFDDKEESQQDDDQSVGIWMILVVIVHRLLDADLNPDLLQAAVLAVRRADSETLHSSRMSELRARLNKLPSSARSEICKADLHCLQRFSDGNRLNFHIGRMLWRGPIEYRPDDIHWLLELIRTTDKHIEDRKVFLELAFHVATSDGHAGYSEEIRAAVADSPSLLHQFSLALDSLKPSDEFRKLRDDEQKRKDRQRKKDAEKEMAWREFWQAMSEKTALAFSPGRRDCTFWNVGVLLEKVGDRHRWDRAFMEKHFGRATTDALRLALMDYWRSMEPSIRSERKTGEKNTSLIVWSLGLLGIYAEAEDSKCMRKLNDREARLAARYALLELNGLPSWLDELADIHPLQVQDIIGNQLDNELSNPADPESGLRSLLQTLRHGSVAVARLMQPRLLAWLDGQAHQPVNETEIPAIKRAINDVLHVLLVQGDRETHRHLEDMATKQLVVPGGDVDLASWISVLCAVNPAVGVSHLLGLLGDLPVEENGKAVEIIGSLMDEHRPRNLSSLYPALQIDSCIELAAEIYRHVCPAMDIVHNGVYSPGPRDNAESARRYAFDALMQRSGSEAFRAKLILAERPVFEHLRDRIRELAKETLASELDEGIAGVTEIAALYDGGELPPKTGSAMAQVLLDRLDDLQTLMLSDASPRGAWAMVNDENTLRPALAREFANLAHGAYTVDQEAVTADGKETDIRFRAPPDIQATIELKIGEKDRSARELHDTIQDQLVTKYMAHPNARTGCLLVTVADPDRRWRHPETNALIDRFQLEQLLQAAAQVAQERLGGSARVLARVLDLTPRLGVERPL